MQSFGDQLLRGAVGVSDEIDNALELNLAPDAEAFAQDRAGIAGGSFGEFERAARNDGFGAGHRLFSLMAPEGEIEALAKA